MSVAPSDPDALCHLGGVLSAHGRDAEASELYRRALESDPVTLKP